jgi:hypothetical protein
MDFNTDHFSLFELPASFRLDAALLDRPLSGDAVAGSPRPLCERW